MSDGFAYLDVLIFAMIAAFFAYRLRGVLGRRTGNERRPQQRMGRPERAEAPNELPPHADAEPEPVDDAVLATIGDPALKAGLAEVRASDPAFEVGSFLEGARAAFAMIVEAFAKGDRAALRPLLADRVFGEFARAIDDREGRGWSHTTELVALRSAEPTAAGKRGTRARVSVRFASEQINATRDADGAVVDGDAQRVIDVTDVWTFERDTRSGDPNWALAETGPAT